MSPHIVQSKKHTDKKKKIKNQKKTTLHHAVNCGDVDKLKLLLRKGADIDALDVGGFTALHIAVEHGDVECTKFLLSNGADVEIPRKDGFTAVHIAAGFGLSVLLKSLLDHKADINTSADGGLTPLHVAVQKSQTECTKMLVQRGACINAALVDGKTPLHLAVSDSNNCIEILMEDKADIFAEDCRGICPLEIATELGLDVVKQLLSRRANKTLSPFGTTPLHIAARCVNSECLKFFIEGGCDVNVHNKAGDTPLHFACLNGSSINSILRIPVQLSQMINIEMLIRCGANIAKKNNKGFAPVHLCALYNRHVSLLYLHKFGADINLRGGERKSTPLHLACEQGSIDCVRFLVECGADINAVDKDKSTSLMLAAKKGDSTAVRFLLENDALLWLENNNTE